MIKLDLIGKRFGRLMVIKRNGLLSNGKTNVKAWECLCDCGATVTVRGVCLRSGNTKSCGCYQDEVQIKAHTTHGLSHDPLYKLWIGIKKRCSEKGSQKDKRFYRNINVSTEWLEFEKFYEWAKSKWSKGLDIDRINTLKGYSSDNCRFVTRKQNTQNKKNCKFWHIEGKTFNSSGDAAKFFKCSQSHIYYMCCGRKTKTKYYPPKTNCKAEEKYDNC